MLNKLILFGAWLPATALLLLNAGCNLSTGNETVRNVSVDVSGLYLSSDGGPIVSQNSGAAITQLDIRQQGDQLTAVTNNGAILRGTIGSTDGTNASFTLSGNSAAGVAVTLTGSISASGSTGTLSGTWIEPGFFGNVSASAGIRPVESGDSGTNTDGDSGTVDDGDGTTDGGDGDTTDGGSDSGTGGSTDPGDTDDTGDSGDTGDTGGSGPPPLPG